MGFLLCWLGFHRYQPFLGEHPGDVVRSYWCVRCKHPDTLHGRRVVR